MLQDYDTHHTYSSLLTKHDAFVTVTLPTQQRVQRGCHLRTPQLPSFLPLANRKEPAGTRSRGAAASPLLSFPLLCYRLSRDDNDLFTFTVVNSLLGGGGGNKPEKEEKRKKAKAKKNQTEREQKQRQRTPTLQKGCTHRLHTELQWWTSSRALPERSAAACIPRAEGPRAAPQRCRAPKTAIKCTCFVQIIQREEKNFCFLLKMIFYSKVLNIASFSFIGITFKKV